MARHQVAIIGGGPAGLMLGQLCHVAGIDAVVLERQSRAHVLSRIRAGVLEQGLIALLREARVPTRMDRLGFTHDGTLLSHETGIVRVDFAAHTGTPVMVYGQTEVTRDLYAARDAAGATTLHGVSDVTITPAEIGRPGTVRFTHDNDRHEIAAEVIAGCDGFRGPSRQAIPRARRREFERVYPFGWLGILSETAPVHHELIYANSSHGFALCSMRNDRLSRYYIQVPATDHPDAWSDSAFWDALRRRIPARFAETLETGPAIEKSIAPLRSFVVEPMQWGNLFLCGDAAHIVPPTGAKGLNTAASDVHYLNRALQAFFHDADRGPLERYSETALARVWKTQRFSWWMTKLLHRFPDTDDYELRIQRAEIDLLATVPAAQAAMAINYVGLPY